jgi:hypothetical protein
MDVAYLGAISASTQTQLAGVIADLEALHLQATMDLQTLGDQGVDVSRFAAELDALGKQLNLLSADVVTMTGAPAELSAWQARADALKASLLDVLKRTGAARQSAPEAAQLRGLGWGLGVLLVATLAGAYVWSHRAKRRRRR